MYIYIYIWVCLYKCVCVYISVCVCVVKALQPLLGLIPPAWQWFRPCYVPLSDSLESECVRPSLNWVLIGHVSFVSPAFFVSVGERRHVSKHGPATSVIDILYIYIYIYIYTQEQAELTLLRCTWAKSVSHHWTNTYRLWYCLLMLLDWLNWSPLEGLVSSDTWYIKKLLNQF